jgi:hypothetical protein
MTQSVLLLCPTGLAIWIYITMVSASKYPGVVETSLAPKIGKERKENLGSEQSGQQSSWSVAAFPGRATNSRSWIRRLSGGDKGAFLAPLGTSPGVVQPSESTALGIRARLSPESSRPGAVAGS